jgi:hypothetical protein
VGGGAPRTLLWVAAGEAGIFAYDVTTPATPVEVASYDTPGSANALCIERDQVHVADGVCGILSLAIEDAPAAAPSASPAVASALPLACSPNPCRGVTAVSFEMPAAGQVTLDVLDIAGRRVASLAQTSMPAGAHTVRWDGRDERGARLTAGCYFVRLSAGGTSTTRKVIVVN